MSDNNKDLQKIVVDDTVYLTKLTPKFAVRKAFAPKDPKKICAVIPGVILDVTVNKGQHVKRDQSMLVLEAMKMRNSIKAPFDGIIKSIQISKGERVAKGELLIEFE
ncbi:MAG: acetyl-CoA carboxylase biotin carboxyl carrier protein subunit [Ignavibacteria bacterium]|jgi:biotin carboxyl carrier protein|nr:acetyl-CoA carboxylase biotin carboxyl carrier protein subunit [Ignavibacteria bacterium]HEX2960979.1 biotin/lipoyl-containing protein [Ignavibacteriales bacterium]MCU7500106.1 acetyl-CoA carboxylase biotin carboxyl carrier protein subunit [Ignavibacteria bacterium]MCU7514418.1 acetyl-CoA carboxylase biotin carboxyl carrier protein subunit [Ignavibacteria bacterium]MCU7520828.1 acetyl-CoA carboxylase biotin carboxyl carrier protein subunit [Ignavibacteria bacterium]